MVVYYREANCQAEKNWFTIVNVKVTVIEGLYNRNMTISTISSKLLVRLQPNSVW